MKIGYFQFDRTNPYQTRFYQAVRETGAEVVPMQPARLFPFRGIDSLDVLHLDWLHPFYASRRGPIVRAAKSWSAIAQLRQTRRAGRPKLVHTVHNIRVHDSYLSERREQRVFKDFLSQIDALVAFSPAVFDALDKAIELKHDQQRFVIPHGHYIDCYAAPQDPSVARSELGLPADVPVVLFFGYLRESKGILDLLNVFADVHSRTGAHLVVAGACDSEKIRGALSKAEEYVRVSLRRIDDQEIPLFFGAADVVALPFREILNSGSAILAASMGKVAVMPNIASLHANLYHPALHLYRPGDLGGLKSALVEALQNPRDELAVRGQAARQHAERDLSWDRIGGLAAQMYAEVVKG